MIRNSFFLAILCLAAACSGTHKASSNTNSNGAGNGWISLFNGTSLDGWRASEAPGTFKVEDGSIVVNGPRSHLYYMGPVMDHNFKNFEFKTQVMTKPGSNSGVYFHTAYQDVGFPDKGFEVQVNNSHTDWKRTAGLYDIVDTRDVNVPDNQWFTLYIKVEGKHVITKINEKTIVDYTEPEGAAPPKGHSGRVISSGTFALQGHDPKSMVLFKDIMVKPLPSPMQ